MFPDNPKPNRSLTSFPGFPTPDRTAKAFPGFPILGVATVAPTPEEIFNYLDGWNQSQIYEITVDSSLISSNLTDFPVLVDIKREYQTYTALSIVLDITDGWGATTYLGLRSVEFYLHGNLIEIPSTFITADATSEFSTTYDPDYIFTTGLSKTDGAASTGWLTPNLTLTNQRVVCAFDHPITFDEIIVNNYHNTGGNTNVGSKNTKIYLSDSTLTSTTFEETISDGVLVFDGILTQHYEENYQHPESLVLLNNTDLFSKYKTYKDNACLEANTEGEEDATYTGGAFDGVINDTSANGSWYAYDSGYLTTGWTGQDFGDGYDKIIELYRIYTDNTDYAPKSWTFEASHTGAWAGEEVILHSVSGAVFTSELLWWDYEIVNTTAYRYYRLNVTENNGNATYLVISEIQMQEKMIADDAGIRTEIVLIHSDEVDGSTVFKDSSKSGFEFTASNCTHEDTQAKFGDTGIYLPGTGGLTFSAGDQTLLKFDHDFTIDQWIYPTGGGSLSLVNYESANKFHALYLDSSTSGRVLVNGGNSITGIVLTASTWQHFALVRKDDSLKAYIDGVQSGTTGTVSGNVGEDTLNYIGRSTATHYGNGYIDEFRITRGVALWDDTFTPPTASAHSVVTEDLFDKLSYDNSKDALLIHSDDTDAAVVFIDSSPAYNSITVAGNTEHSTDQSKFGASSIYFDGTGDYLTSSIVGIPIVCDTFTIDLWVYAVSSNTATDRALIIGDGVYNSSTSYWSFGLDDSDKVAFRWWDGTSNVATSTSAVPLSTWTHITVTVDAGTIYLFINGVSETIVGTSTLTDRSATGTVLTLGASDSTYLDGYIDEVRIKIGEAVWTDDFDFPRKPYTNHTIDEVGENLILTDTDATELYTEIQAWDANAGSMILWALVPSILSLSDTKLYLYYDESFTEVPNTITAKSIILDIADNHGATSMVLRSVDFWLEGEKVSVLTADITCYATSSASSTYDPDNVFDTSYSKIGSYDDTSWNSGASQDTNQRVICVFDTPIVFDSIIVNNGHSSGASTTAGLNNVQIHSSTDAITSTVYGAAIANSTELFDDVFVQHTSLNQEQAQVVYSYNMSEERKDANLIIYSDRADASTEVIDNSLSGHSIVVTSVTHDETYAKFGDTSLEYASTGSRLVIPASQDFNFGTDPFTIDFWIRKSSYSGNAYMFDIGTNGTRMTINGSTLYVVQNTTTIINSAATAPEVDVWTHIALTNDGTTYRVFYNGVQVDSNATSTAFGNHLNNLTVGNYGSGGYSIIGNMDQFRVTKGTALWVADFIPPLRSLSEAITYTGAIGTYPVKKVWEDDYKVVMHLNQDPDGDASGSILDSTFRENNGTPAGTMLSEDLVDGLIGKSIQFDGTDDNIGIADSIDFSELTTDDFTLNISCSLGVITQGTLLAIGSYTNGIMVYLGSSLIYVYVANAYGAWTWSNAVDTDYVIEVKRVSGTVSVTVDNTALSLDSGSASLSGSVLTTSGMRIAYGFAGGANHETDGIFHEVRFAHAGRSSAWSSADYYNMTNSLVSIAEKV